MIYYLQCDCDGGPIKIGFTDGSVVTRIKQLQQASPFVLNTLCVHEGDREMEMDLHSKFLKFRLRGEWFSPSEDLISHINSVNGGNPLGVLNSLIRPDLREAIRLENYRSWDEEAKRVYRALKRSFGSDYSAWISGLKPIRNDHAQAIEKFLSERVAA